VKKIDKLLLRSFVAPFITTFFIALFVLIMQFLWTYIDDILGKGASFLVILELLSYLSVSLIPTALPIAVLISSVMVLGNMAERFELTSLKSAGVPLLRVMMPLIFLTSGIAIFSFFCSNYIIPVANLKFKSRLYDIKRQKPTLSLEQGVFNDDFKNMIIHIGSKDKDNKTIRDVIIYDHNSYNNKKVSVITAEKGEMYTTQDERFFIMNLFKGTQYQETKANNTKKDKSYPFVRTSFKEWRKVFDLSEFDLNETREDLFKSHQTMLSTAQLRVSIDSLTESLEERQSKIHNRINRSIYILKDSLIEIESKNTKKYNDKYGHTPDPEMSKNIKKSKEKAAQAKANKKKKQSKKKTKPKKSTKSKNKKPQKKTKTTNKKNTKPKKKPNKKKSFNSRTGYPQINLDSLDKVTSILQLFKPENRKKIIDKSKPLIRSVANELETSIHFMERKQESWVKHVYELNIKFSMALVCIIFLFIGAPMGAIIRKGGFGYPILVAIFFFMLFIVMNIFCKKVAESNAMPAVIASWVPCMILFPIGVILTYRAMNDSKILNTDKYTAFIMRILNRWGKGKELEETKGS